MKESKKRSTSKAAVKDGATKAGHTEEGIWNIMAESKNVEKWEHSHGEHQERSER
jgi:hypothetical protein